MITTKNPRHKNIKIKSANIWRIDYRLNKLRNIWSQVPYARKYLKTLFPRFFISFSFLFHFFRQFFIISFLFHFFQTRKRNLNAIKHKNWHYFIILIKITKCFFFIILSPIAKCLAWLHVWLGGSSHAYSLLTVFVSELS